MPFPLIPFYFVRHGETEANVAENISGWLDSPLTEKGKKQAEEVATIVNRLDVKPSKIFHSDLSRARDTAYIINNSLNVDITEHMNLREHNFGEYEGTGYENFAHMRDGTAPKNGESNDMFQQRIISIFNDILPKETGPVLITAHGGFIHQIQKIFKQGSHHFAKNCHLHYFEPFPENEAAPWKIYVFDDEEGKIVKSPAKWCPSKG